MFQTMEQDENFRKRTKCGDNLPNKECKVMIIRMLTKCGRMNTVRISTQRNYKEEPNRAKEYNN